MRELGLRPGPKSEAGRVLVDALRLWALGALIASVSFAQPARIPELEAHGRAGAPDLKRGFVLTPMPSIYGTEELQETWHAGRKLEFDQRFLEAAELHADLADALPDHAYAYWKVSRNLWRHAETLPVDAKAERMALFERADTWADRGLAVDGECAPCMLWKFGAMGRIATTRGVMASLGMGREMQRLLQRGISLSPDFADSDSNSTLGNLYYASAVFHRVVPEWAWLKWLAGVKGDLDHSLQMIRRAVELAPQRIDYLVEYGAVLHCYGERREAAWARRQANQILDDATKLEPQIGTDVIDQQHAQTLMGAPSRSCGYSRDGWIDTAKHEVARAH